MKTLKMAGDMLINAVWEQRVRLRRLKLDRHY